MLLLNNIEKSYGNNKILEGINLNLDNGIYGFLGSNGVGKTTLFKIISGYITDYRGQVIYPKLNQKKEIRTGFLPQNFSGYPDMTISQFLLYMGNIKTNIAEKKIKCDMDEKMELFNLTDIKDKKLKALSGGQLRRVGLAQAFQLSPRIVMLDEPTTGLDPAERIRFKNYISEIGHDQIILLSTHIVTDLEYICKEIYVLKNKHFVMSGTEAELIHQCMGAVWEVEFEDESELQFYTKKSTVSMIYDHGEKIRARLISDVSPAPSAIEVAPNLNDVYLINFKKEAHR